MSDFALGVMHGFGIGLLIIGAGALVAGAWRVQRSLRERARIRWPR